MLTALALVTAGLSALGLLSFLLPGLAYAGTAALCGAGGALALSLGPPGVDGGRTRLALDRLTGFALLPPFLWGCPG